VRLVIGTSSRNPSWQSKIHPCSQRECPGWGTYREDLEELGLNRGDFGEYFWDGDFHCSGVFLEEYDETI